MAIALTITGKTISERRTPASESCVVRAAVPRGGLG